MAELLSLLPEGFGYDDNSLAAEALLFQVQTRVALEVDASLRRAAQKGGAMRTAELEWLCGRLLCRVPPFVADIVARTRPDAAARSILFFELLNDFYAAALFAVSTSSNSRASDVLILAEAVEAAELLHQTAISELWSHALFPEVYALAFYAYVSLAPPEAELQRLICALLDKANREEASVPEGAGGDAALGGPIQTQGIYIAALQEEVLRDAPLRSAEAFIARNDGAASNRVASLTSGANRLFWRDANSGEHVYSAVYGALYHAATARGQLCTPRDRNSARGCVAPAPSSFARTDSVERFDAHVAAAAAAWSLPVDGAALAATPAWLQRDVIVLLLRWYPWYGARVSTPDMLASLGGGGGGSGGGHGDGVVDDYVHELALHMCGLRSEVALLAYVHSVRHGLSASVPHMGPRTANLLHSALHKLATPGGPVYPSRRVRHAAQATIDELFPAGRIPRRLVQLCFRLAHPLRWPPSLGHWVAGIIWAALAWAAAATGARRCCVRSKQGGTEDVVAWGDGQAARWRAPSVLASLIMALARAAVAVAWALCCPCVRRK